MNVSFAKFGLLNIFKGCTKSRLESQIRSQIAEWNSRAAVPDTDEVKSTIANNTSRALSRRYDLNPETGFPDARDNEIVVYGFSSVRAQNIPSLEGNHNVFCSTIDEYNRGIGVEPQAMGVLKIGEHLAKIKKGTCNVQQPYEGYSLDKVTQWMNFLQRPENFKKIDILGRLREYIGIGLPSHQGRQAGDWLARGVRTPWTEKGTGGVRAQESAG